MMQNLMLEEGGLLQVESASLPVASFSRFQPHSLDFLDLTNPKAVLESRLRNFACLTAGDVIAIHYNNKTYELSVLETKPAPAVSIIECDMNVEFAAPVGYQEPERVKPADREDTEEAMDVTDLLPEPTGFIPFQGSGNRLDGKKKRQSSETSSGETPKPRADYVRGIPDFDFEIGELRFIRNLKPKMKTNGDSADDGFEAFRGEGQSLRSGSRK